MTLTERIDALVKLGLRLKENDDELQAVMHQSYIHNRWFVVENIQKSISAICDCFLDRTKLKAWISNYEIPSSKSPKTVALILAGNIPLVGFHDVLCVFLAGHRSKIKLSDKDKFLLPYFIKLMAADNPAVNEYFEFIERLKDFDAVIATGSNNSARYFESYFGKYPHIIRKNRNAIAVLDGQENAEDLQSLGLDVFNYFGLGCRNVSKLYLPQGYKFEPLLEAMHEHKEIILNDKYKNNFDYHYTLLILNKIEYKANGCIIMTEDESLQSRIASLHYEYYQDEEKLATDIQAKDEEIQCVVSKKEIKNVTTIPFGKAQQPELTDYADGVDTMAFLLAL